MTAHGQVRLRPEGGTAGPALNNLQTLHNTTHSTYTCESREANEQVVRNQKFAWFPICYLDRRERSPAGVVPKADLEAIEFAQREQEDHMQVHIAAYANPGATHEGPWDIGITETGHPADYPHTYQVVRSGENYGFCLLAGKIRAKSHWAVKKKFWEKS